MANQELTTTVATAKQLGEALRVLVNAGITDEFEATCAALSATPAGGSPERHAALEGLRVWTEG